MNLQEKVHFCSDSLFAVRRSEKNSVENKTNLEDSRARHSKPAQLRARKNQM